MSALTYTGELVVVACWCGIHHAVPESLHDLQQRRHANGEAELTIFCPLGHGHVPAGPGKVARLEERLKAAQHRADAERDLRRDTERRLVAQKGATTRAKRRHAAAVCPCCSRSFVQLRRHMAAQHPEHLAAYGIAPERP